MATFSPDEIAYALMAANAYANSVEVRTATNAMPVPDGWTALAAPQGWPTSNDVDSDNPPGLVLTSSGFMARAYTNGSKIVIAYGGTTLEDFNDWPNGNITGGTAVELAPEIYEAAKFYLDMKKLYPNASFSFTGHSLDCPASSLAIH